MHSASVSIKEGEGVDDGLFRIVLLNLLSFNQETNSLISEELYCDKKNHSKKQQNRKLMTNTNNRTVERDSAVSGY